MAEPKVFALILACCLGAPLAAEAAADGKPSADACGKTVNAIGASMGYTEFKGPNGEPAFRYVVRTNGVDYDVLCQASTGVVTDVSPRVAAPETAAP